MNDSEIEEYLYNGGHLIILPGINAEHVDFPTIHNILPDISKEMFTYLLKRVAVLEYAIKEQDGIDVSKEDAELEDIYANFIDAMKQ